MSDMSDMPDSWFQNKENVIELAEFLVESEQLTTAEELLEYFKNPDRYDEVWNMYQEEIIGNIPKHNFHKKIPKIPMNA
jgi:hypothetical protein